MSGERLRKNLWGAWVVATIALVAWLGWTMLTAGTDKTVFMPGALSPGHHQLAEACDACHTDPLGGGAVLQEACTRCHGEDRRKPFDSHPAGKFRDPRNADRLVHIDALHCVTCHVEHRPEITAKNGLTRPADLCVHCHEDIGEERPSHAGMDFASCATGGCHNFHNNRALYTDFLIKHLDEPAVSDEPVVPEREFAQVLGEIAGYPADRYPVQPLAVSDADAPATLPGDDAIAADWAASAHARSGVNCTACHQPPGEDGVASAWRDDPGEAACSGCHDLEIERFGKGKHGMRIAAGLDPLQVADARLPMREEAAHEELTCNSCHGAHTYDTRAAAVEACTGCHDDGHTTAYAGSPHDQLWQLEQAGHVPEGSGVSCASCHMPRINFDVSEWLSRIMVDHNQSANLAPNSKMVRSSCLHCHGLEFSLDALADPRLIANNFAGKPAVHVETMDLAAAEKLRRDQEAADDDDAGMFGF